MATPLDPNETYTNTWLWSDRRDSEMDLRRVYVFITAVPIIKLFACVFITAVPITKLFAREGGGEMEDMCYERLRAEAYVH